MNLAILNRKIRQNQVTAHDEHDLLALASLSHAALAAAIHLWESTAPDDVKGLLTGAQGWKWDETIQGYRALSSRIIRDAELKELAEMIATSVKKKSRHNLLLLLLGQLGVIGWRHTVATDLAALYILMGALGSGGISKLSPATNKIVSGHPDKPPGLIYTLKRLRVFTRKLEQDRENVQAQTAVGFEPAVPPGAGQRMDMYVDSARPVFEEARRHSCEEEAKRVGKKLEARNILGEAEHCETTNGIVGCLNLTKRGWVPASEMPVPGTRFCVTGCKCRLNFRMVES